MRPIEALLIGADLLAFLALALPLAPALLWMKYAVPAAALIGLAQALVEGPRWEVAPAYGLTGALVLVWLGNFAPAGGRISRVKTNRFVASLGIGVGVLGLL